MTLFFVHVLEFEIVICSVLYAPMVIVLCCICEIFN
jgi:hypothetical protein